MLCVVLGTSLLYGCGSASDSGDRQTSTQAEESDEDDDEDENTRGIVDAVEDQEKEEVQEVSEEPEEEAIPRSDAYEMFLAGELEVNVLYDPGDVYSEGRRPRLGTYTYDELVEELKEVFYTDFDVNYALFTPDTGKEGDDVMALYLESEAAAGDNWMGFIAYVDGELVMNYNEFFGYRSFLELYWDGKVMSGGSGGAGASYNFLSQVYPDASVKTVFKEAYFYSTWCNEVAYIINPDIAYEDVPVLADGSNIEMDVVYDDDGNVQFSVTAWSDNKATKAEEEAFVQALVDMGAVQTDVDTIAALTETGIDESKTMNWNKVESVTVDAG